MDDGRAAHRGRDLLKNLQPFPSDRGFKAVEASNVALRMREVCDESASNRIGHLGENDRDSAGDRLQRRHCRICVGDDYIWSKRYQFRGRGACALDVSFGEPVIDLNIATVGPTKLFKPLLKCREASLCFGIVFAERLSRPICRTRSCCWP